MHCKLHLILGHDVLRKENAEIIVNELINVRRVVYELGLALNVPQDVMDSIREENPRQLERLIRVIDEFLDQESPSPSWRRIVDALRSPQVQCTRLAAKLERKYCTVIQGIYFIS